MRCVYNNWGHYDEIGDKVPLTEGLVMEELDVLEEWRHAHGVTFDVFVIDCMWFDPERGYKEFRRGDWPGGGKRVLARIRELGMTPGLWYSVNGVRLSVRAWEESVAEDGVHYSLAYGPFGAALEEGMHHAAREWGVRYFKLDFANLRSAAKGDARGEVEVRRRSTERLREILGRLRASYEGVYVITHCGFARRPPEVAMRTEELVEVDTGWLDVVDAVFSGDPQCTDIPQTALVRNIDLFQDRQVWKLAQSGFPLHRIEDHGVMVGRTNTTMYRGRTGFRRSYVGQLARGGRREMVYGDLSLLTVEDVEFLKRGRALFADAFGRGLWTRYVGVGEPGLCGWHGYLTGGGASGILYLVNATLAREVVELPLLELHAARVLFHDGRAPALEVQPEYLRVELGPEQVVLIGLGRYADERWELPPDEDVSLPLGTRVVPLEWEATVDGICAEVGAGELQVGEQLLIVAQVLDAEPAGVLQALPYRFGRQDTRTSDDRTPRTHELVEIRCEEGGREVPVVKQIPDVPVWSGISWVARVFAPRGACCVRVRQRLEPRRRLRVSARALRYG